MMERKRCPHCHKSLIPKEERVPVGPIRDAVARSSLSRSEIARRSGYIAKRRGGTEADISHMNRTIGYKPWPSRGGQYWATTMPYSKAVRFAHALELDPVDLGV